MLWGGGVVCLVLIALMAIESAAERSQGTPVPADSPDVAALPGSSSIIATPAPTPPPPKNVLTRQWFNDHNSSDSYADVDNHLTATVGAVVEWNCTVEKILGPDSLNAQNEDATCLVDGSDVGGLYSSPLPEFVADMVGSTVNTDAINPGDQVRVTGMALGPFDGTNAFGAPIEEPYVLAEYVDDPARSS